MLPKFPQSADNLALHWDIDGGIIIIFANDRFLISDGILRLNITFISPYLGLINIIIADLPLLLTLQVNNLISR
jgi:hypothetical protein